MSDWVDLAAKQILRDWNEWDSEAGQSAQNEQDSNAYTNHMIECITNKLRWLRANHAQGETEVARLRAGLGMIAQLLSCRVSCMIAQATLDGANLLDEDVAIDVCEGYWRKPK